MFFANWIYIGGGSVAFKSRSNKNNQTAKTRTDVDEKGLLDKNTEKWNGRVNCLRRRSSNRVFLLPFVSHYVWVGAILEINVRMRK